MRNSKCLVGIGLLVVVVCACERPSERALSKDSLLLLEGRPRWAKGRNSIGVLVHPEVLSALELKPLAVLQRVWEVEGGPKIQLVPGTARGLREDGINSVAFASPSRRCGPSVGLQKSDECLEEGQSGATRLSTRAGKCSPEIVEADIVLDRAFLAGPRGKLRETFFHELGHALGLPHVPSGITSEATIMLDEEFGVRRPTSFDRRMLQALYSMECSR